MCAASSSGQESCPDRQQSVARFPRRRLRPGQPIRNYFFESGDRESTKPPANPTVSAPGTRRGPSRRVPGAETVGLAGGFVDSRRQIQKNRFEQANPGRSRRVETGRPTAAVRQTPYWKRRRAQADPGFSRPEKTPSRGLQKPRHLLRRPGGSGEGRSGGPCGPDDLHAHGQVHRHDARSDRAHRHDREGRARRGGDRIDPAAQGGVSHRGGRRGLPRGQGDPQVARGRLRRSRHGSDLRVRGRGHAGHRRGRRERRFACTAPAPPSGPGRSSSSSFP